LIFIVESSYSQINELKAIIEIKLLDLQYKDSIHFYNTPNLDDRYISIYNVTEHDRILNYSNNIEDQGRLFNITKNLIEFNPIYFYYDYFIMNPICVGFNGDFYKIKISNGNYKYLNKFSDYLHFVSFKSLLGSKEILVNKLNTFYDKPDETSMKVDFNDRLTYEVIAINNDWLKLRSLPEIYFDDLDQVEDEDDPIYEGWIKWKEGEEVFIHFLLRP